MLRLEYAQSTIPSTTTPAVDGGDGAGVDDQGNHSTSTTQVGPMKLLQTLVHE